MLYFKGAKVDAETKALGALEIKDATKGEVEAIVATLGVVDRDGDIISPDAIKGGASVIVSAYGHDAVFGARPAGKGTLSVRGNKAVFSGRMFLNTTDGRDTFEVLKEMGADQEWSFGFRIMGEEVPTDAQKKQGAYRVLTKLDAFEVSPVLMGAGVGTRTVGVKQADGDPAESAPAAAEPAVVVDEATLDAPAAVDDVEAKRLEKEADTKAAQIASDAAAEFARLQRNIKRYG